MGLNLVDVGIPPSHRHPFNEITNDKLRYALLNFLDEHLDES